MNINKLLHISIIKTLRFNLHYFPFKTAVRLPVIISRNVSLKEMKGSVNLKQVQRGIVTIGFNEVGIFDRRHSRTLWEVCGNVTFDGRASIGIGSKISVSAEGELCIGDRFTITAHSALICQKQIRLGEGCLMSWDILIMDSDFHPIRDHSGTVINEPCAIEIGSHVWIGCRSLILKGSYIPDGSVIGAASLVSGKLPTPNACYAGSPCKVIKEEIQWGH
ncbi:MAG: acyltransferase [Mediterranea sp.]|jgi:acetyltransferase-like isoleucine patch superfamily enzyme|nr:acyltransferase [Mediterranea sp.]